MSLSSIRQSIGTPSISTLPSNRSMIVADSRYRDDDVNESPYDFTAQLGGTGIYAKELYYQKLYWNQPLFSHNNTNCELRFQMNGDESVTYVVYATPFLLYTQYDGNPPGTSLLPPVDFSYALNMTMALNGDVRSLPTNTMLVNGDGYIRDSLGNVIEMNFRYSPTKGFCIYPTQPPNPRRNPLHYTIRLLPCSYISNAHYVHGFGVWDPNNPELGYVPVSMWSAVYWSDVSPNLLPIRYIVIQSAELNKDRRMISFHNGNFSNFVNELGLFSLNPAYTGVFHEDGVGDDATVISLRDDYKPQRFKIQVLDEYGNVLRCDDPIKNLLSSGLYPRILGTFFDNVYRNRGNQFFTDLIVFGITPMPRTGIPKELDGVLDTQALSQPNGMLVNFQTGFLSNDNPYANPYNWIPVVLTDTQLTPLEAEFGTGFAADTTRAQYVPPGIVGNWSYTQFTYYQQINPAPAIGIQIDWNSFSFGGSPANAVYSIVMFEATATDPTTGTIQYAVLYEGFLYNGDSGSIPTNYSSSILVPMVRNPGYNPDPKPKGRKVGFALMLYATDPALTFLQYTTMNPLSVLEDFRIVNMRDTANLQVDYIPPNTNENSYPFGDPQAVALCEELVHEIAAMLEFN